MFLCIVMAASVEGNQPFVCGSTWNSAMDLAWSICNIKSAKGIGLGLCGNAAAREVSCGCATLAVWWEVLVGSVVTSGDQWWSLAFFCFAYLEDRADFLRDFPPWRRVALITVLDLSLERRTLGASSKVFWSGVIDGAPWLEPADPTGWVVQAAKEEECFPDL